jgi:hypothetical protein
MRRALERNPNSSANEMITYVTGADDGKGPFSDGALKHTPSEAVSPIAYQGRHATGAEMIASTYNSIDNEGAMQYGTASEDTSPMQSRGRYARCALDALERAMA